MTESMLLNKRYQLLHPLGTGGMALVYKAHDLLLERTVAIKLLREDYSSDPDFRERFRQEARSAGNLSHPNIVTVHDFGLDQSYLFIVMEYIPGTDLKTLIRKKGIFGVSDALNLLIQACAGIGYAHRAGLVHCDIKPHNILVSPDQHLKVTDFGIARALSSISLQEKSDIVWGSPHYFSPEQASGLAPSPASDVYSLGIILYEMLTGRLPFDGKDATELARMQREDPPLPPKNFNDNIPQKIEDIILKVLSKEPSYRYRTADQLGHLLLNFSKTEGYNNKSESYHFQTDPSQVLNSDHQQSLQLQPQNFEKTKSDQSQTLPADFLFDEEEEGEVVPSKSIDWVTWGLGLLAFSSLMGLIPFWLYIYFTLKP